MNETYKCIGRRNRKASPCDVQMRISCEINLYCLNDLMILERRMPSKAVVSVMKCCVVFMLLEVVGLTAGQAVQPVSSVIKGSFGLNASLDTVTGTLIINRILPPTSTTTATTTTTTTPGNQAATNASTTATTTTATTTTTTTDPSLPLQSGTIFARLLSLQQFNNDSIKNSFIGQQLFVLSNCSYKFVGQVASNCSRFDSCFITGTDTYIEMMICPIISGDQKSALFVDITLKNWFWCNNSSSSSSSSSCLQSYLDVNFELTIQPDKVISDSKNNQYKLGFDSAYVAFNKSYMEKASEGIWMNFPLNVYGFSQPTAKQYYISIDQKIFHMTSSLNTSLAFNFTIDPGYEIGTPPSKYMVVSGAIAKGNFGILWFGSLSGFIVVLVLEIINI
ncbi:hypothetical protein HELRODRAFT_190945 [Helobdella robusta]|uniref:Uncharacterized protein n=1 Tax=Helobdella robusta TaxID=6412 RepID=T1FSG2_HELRO|nr:hypothetical protein HELRODRAFT_190945 [Helobdella robusta]ESO08218.1 hypothetical protein HELRODRAFT_190945 [Helobdella robusta]